MTEETSTAPVAEETQTEQKFAVQRFYLKDLSLKRRRARQPLTSNGSPKSIRT